MGGGGERGGGTEPVQTEAMARKDATLAETTQAWAEAEAMWAEARAVTERSFSSRKGRRRPRRRGGAGRAQRLMAEARTADRWQPR